MKDFLRKADNVLSYVLLILMSGLLVFSIFTFVKAQKTGEPAFLFGYRPMYVLTGSMEPTMMTHSVAITQKVTDLDELEVGDIITYHVTQDNGVTVRITHRINEITEDGQIITKGDNNDVTDAYPLTMSNVESEVVFIMNWLAAPLGWLTATLSTTSGKIMIFSFGVGIILLYFGGKIYIQAVREEKKKKELGDSEKSEKPVDGPDPESDADSAVNKE